MPLYDGADGSRSLRMYSGRGRGGSMLSWKQPTGSISTEHDGWTESENNKFKLGLGKCKSETFLNLIPNYTPAIKQVSYEN